MTKHKGWLVGFGVLALLVAGVVITIVSTSSDSDDSDDDGVAQPASETGSQPLRDSVSSTTVAPEADELTEPERAEQAPDNFDEIEPESGDPEILAAIESVPTWQPVLQCINGLEIQSDGTDWRIEGLSMTPQPLEDGKIPRKAMVELCGAEPTEEDLRAQAEAVESLAYELTVLGPITFEPGTTDLTDDSKAVLDNVAGLLKAQAGALVEVAGHADSRGSEADNLLLSEQRAETVVFELEQRGVLNELVPVGRGEAVLRQLNEDDAEALLQNRRIELRVIL